MTVQQQAAKESLIEWLSHEQELGHKPRKLSQRESSNCTACATTYLSTRRIYWVVG